MSTTRPVTGHRPEVALQHRRLALPRGLAYQRKAGSEDGQRQCGLAPRRIPAQRKAQAGTGNRTGNARPQRRFELQYEIDPNPGAKENRQPQQAAVALGGEAIAKGRPECARPMPA